MATATTVSTTATTNGATYVTPADDKVKTAFSCETCALNFASQSILDTHLVGARHAKKLEAVKILNKLQDSELMHIEINHSKSLFTCRVCQVTVNSSQQLQAHLKGTKHEDAVKGGGTVKTEGSGDLPSKFGGKPYDPAKKRKATDGEGAEGEGGDGLPTKKTDKEPENHFCYVCGIGVNSSTQLQQHMSSQKHKNKLSGYGVGKTSSYSSGQSYGNYGGSYGAGGGGGGGASWQKSSGYQQRGGKTPLLNSSRPSQSYYEGSGYYSSGGYDSSSYGGSGYGSAYSSAYGSDKWADAYKGAYAAAYGQKTTADSSYGHRASMCQCECRCGTIGSSGAGMMSTSSSSSAMPRGTLGRGYGRGRGVASGGQYRPRLENSFVPGGVVNSNY